jgi:putative spermidine/putrescine transport system substrate-binding protein
MPRHDSNGSTSRRAFLLANGVAASVALSGCLGGSDGDDDDGSTNGDDGSNGNDNSGDGGATSDSADTYEVGYGEYQTTVSEDDFPDDKLFVYAVQTGWSNWGAVMDAFQERYGIELNDSQGSSGEALQNARANAQNPQYSAFNGGYSFAIQAMNDGLTTDYKPKGWDAVPDNLKTDNGHCTATRRMTTAVTYRPDVYEERGVSPPETWEDLKDPRIAQDLAFTPPTTANGVASALSVNNAYGGSVDNLDPLIQYHEDIAEHGADFRRNIEGDMTSGEISTVVEFDYSGLNLKYNNDALGEDQVDVALLTGPDGEAGALSNPYGYAMLNGAPNPEAVKLFMDFVLEPETQSLFFDAFVRPIRASELDAPEEFPDQSTYADAQFNVDTSVLVENQASIQEEIRNRSPLPGAK